ncbi:MAG: hypothetical protein MJ159_00285 [Treponemataceae bacterium]|nr:hypothetical protein [Treponemataceae bacterium]
MKKNLFILLFAVIFIFTLSASDIPFLKSLFIGDEEYVRQQILKNCKDVESVEIIPPASNKNDYTYYIHVYLTNNRYLQFSGMLHRFISDNYSRFPMRLWQINDLCPVMYSYDAGRYDLDSLLYYIELKIFEVKLLKGIIPHQIIDNMLDVINNIDEVYSFISDLPELPAGESFYNKYKHFRYTYNSSLATQIPEEFKNDIPFSIFQKEECDFGTYESGYKFYKMSVDRAVKENNYGNLKFKHEKP